MRGVGKTLPLASVLVAACATQTIVETEAFEACKRLLHEQVDAWNRGDLDAFAAGYRRSKDTVFASANGVNIGWEAMLARYRKSYPDRATMGKLAFSELTLARLADDHVTARGRWRLTRPNDHPSGWFVLVFRRTQGHWKIALDYTTSESSP